MGNDLPRPAAETLADHARTWPLLATDSPSGRENTNVWATADATATDLRCRTAS